MGILFEHGTKEEAETELFFWLEILLRGTLFLAKEAVTFPTFSDDDACRFAKDDVVDDENDDRRLPFCVDIFQFFFSKESSFSCEEILVGVFICLRVIILYFLKILLRRGNCVI